MVKCDAVRRVVESRVYNATTANWVLDTYSLESTWFFLPVDSLPRMGDAPARVRGGGVLLDLVDQVGVRGLSADPAKVRSVACFSPKLFAARARLSPFGRVAVARAGDERFEFANGETGYASVPCGRCLGCEQDWKRSWVARLYAELLTCPVGASFLTLTVDDRILFARGLRPLRYASAADGRRVPVWSLDRQWLVDFNDRLSRMARDEGYPFSRLFAAGEYGTKFIRAHGHGAHFLGEELPRSDRFDVSMSGSFPTWRSKFYEKAWGLGRVLVGRMSPATAGYIVGYASKGGAWPRGALEPRDCRVIARGGHVRRVDGREARGGFGRVFALEHKAQLVEEGSLVMRSESGSTARVALPRFMIDVVSKGDPESARCVREVITARAREFQAAQRPEFRRARMEVQWRKAREVTRDEAMTRARVGVEGEIAAAALGDWWEADPLLEDWSVEVDDQVEGVFSEVMGPVVADGSLVPSPVVGLDRIWADGEAARNDGLVVPVPDVLPSVEEIRAAQLLDAELKAGRKPRPGRRRRGNGESVAAFRQATRELFRAERSALPLVSTEQLDEVAWMEVCEWSEEALGVDSRGSA